MKYLPILFTFLTTTSLIAQNPFDVSTIENPEPDKCYGKYVIEKPQYDTIYEKVLLLENNPDLVPYCEVVEEQVMVVSPVFQRIEAFENIEYIKDTIYEFGDDNLYEIEGIIESSWQVIKRKKGAFPVPQNEYLVFCLSEEYKRHEQVIKKEGDSIVWKRTEPLITTIRRSEVDVKIMSSIPKFQTIRKLVPQKSLKKKQLQKAVYTQITQLIEIQPLKFSEWQEVMLVTCRLHTVIDLQMALIRHGYVDYDYCVSSGLNDVMKQYLLDFQEKEGLPMGQINIELLKAFGIFY